MTGWRVAAVNRVARWLVWCGRFVKGWLPRTFGGISTIILVLWGAMSENQWKPLGLTLLIGGVACALLAFVAEIVVQRPSYMELSQLREDAELKAAAKSEALERALRILLIRLGIHCRLDGHSDRLSVYYFHDGEFVMVSRHAKNPVFAVRGRGQYPADQGAIGSAWRAPHGQALVSMPSGNDSWKRAARKQGLGDAAIAGLSMRSLGLAGHRLEASDSSVGVLIVESTTPNRINQTHLDQIAESHIVAAIAELVSAFALMTPAGESIAAAKGAKPVGTWQSVTPRVPIGPASS